MRFSREPAAYIATLGAFLALFADRWSLLSAGQAAALVALLTAGVIAFTTRPIAPALFVGVLNAAVALVSEYGAVVSDNTVANLTAFLVLALNLVGVRPQVTPKGDPHPTAVV